ncbi:hypothetical protein LINPERPRIM_LOCUS1640 [Linum perenne]
MAVASLEKMQILLKEFSAENSKFSAENYEPFTNSGVRKL